jgi:hypothetical protein
MDIVFKFIQLSSDELGIVAVCPSSRRPFLRSFGNAMQYTKQNSDGVDGQGSALVRELLSGAGIFASKAAQPW